MGNSFLLVLPHIYTCVYTYIYTDVFMCIYFTFLKNHIAFTTLQLAFLCKMHLRPFPIIVHLGLYHCLRADII